MSQCTKFSKFDKVTAKMTYLALNIGVTLKCGLLAVFFSISGGVQTVPHRKLLHKLWELGLGLRTWIEHFLLGRQMRSRVNGNYFSWFEILCGVPLCWDDYCF